MTRNVPQIDAAVDKIFRKVSGLRTQIRALERRLDALEAVWPLVPLKAPEQKHSD